MCILEINIPSRITTKVYLITSNLCRHIGTNREPPKVSYLVHEYLPPTPVRLLTTNPSSRIALPNLATYPAIWHTASAVQPTDLISNLNPFLKFQSERDWSTDRV